MKKIISGGISLVLLLSGLSVLAAKDNDVPTSANRCTPIYCSDGQQFPSCAVNGAPIKYFVEPCYGHGGQVFTRPTATASPTVSPTKTPLPNGLGVQLKDKLKDIFIHPKTTVSPTVTPTPKPRKAKTVACKDAFSAAKKVYANAKEKARNEFLAAMKKAISDYQTAYKLAREHKSNEAKKAARDAYQAAKKAVQNRYAADKKAAEGVYRAAREIYNACMQNRPTSTPHNGEISCKNLYWIDNTNNSCGKKQFCGAYMYNGLRTFEEREECLHAAATVTPTPTATPTPSQ